MTSEQKSWNKGSYCIRLKLRVSIITVINVLRQSVNNLLLKGPMFKSFKILTSPRLYSFPYKECFTHTHTHTHSLSLSLSHTHTLSLSLSLSHTHTHTQCTVLTTFELLPKSHTHDSSVSLLVAIRKLKILSHVPIFCAVLKIRLQDVYLSKIC